MPELIYLASPYSHPDSEVMETRFRFVARAAAAMMRDGLMVFSPITHTHPIAVHGELPRGWEFWQAYDEIMVSRCDRVWVLTLDGWDVSKGVKAEIQIAERLRKPLDFIRWDGERYEVLASYAIPA